MKKVLISFVFIVSICVFISCGEPTTDSNKQGTINQTDVINMDSDYSIEKHLAGSWTWTDGTTTCTLEFKDESKTATWVIYGYTYSGNYRVSGRQIICDMHSEKNAPTLFVHELTPTTLEITGVGKVPITVKNMTFTKK